jgi:hypothetical protein
MDPVRQFSLEAANIIASHFGYGPRPNTPIGRQCGHWNLLECGRQIRRMRGLEEVSNEGIYGYLLGSDVPFNTPGDYPHLLSNLANKVVEAATSAETTYREWAFPIRPIKDFRPATITQVGEFGDLPYHADAANFDQSKFLEAVGWIAIDSYGDEFQLTPRMLADDDAEGFVQALADKQAAHEATLNRLCCNLLTGNVTLMDGTPLFHVDHANLAGSGAAPSKTTLSAARLAFRQMLGVGGFRKLGLPLTTLVIPNEHETTCQELLQTTLGTFPPEASGLDVFRGQVQYFVEPLLSDSSTTGWYAFSKRRRSIIYAHQVGFERMVTRSYYQPKNNSRVWQFEGRFAATVVDHRGVYLNAGA